MNSNDEKKWGSAYKKVDATTSRITKKSDAAIMVEIQEYETSKQALEVAYITKLQFRREMAQLGIEHYWRVFMLRRDFERRVQLGLG